MEAVLREIEAERAKRATLVLLIEKKRELAQLKRDNRQMEEELQRAPSCSASDSLAASAAAGGHAKRARAGPPGTEPQAASPAGAPAGGFLCLDPGRKKRVTVCAFKSKILLHVREHFQDGDGAWQPGKKGQGRRRRRQLVRLFYCTHVPSTASSRPLPGAVHGSLTRCGPSLSPPRH